MPRIYITKVPPDVRRTLTARAAQKGMSLSAYVRAVLVREVERPIPEEILGRLRSHERVELDEPSEVTIRRLRDALD